MQESKGPSIEIDGAGIGDIGIESTTLNVTLLINNPIALGSTLKSIKFRVLLLKNSNETFLGDGEKDNIRIGGGGVTRTEIPVKLRNAAIISVAGGLIGDDLDIVIRGTAAIDLKIAAPKIPFEKKVKISGFLKGI